MSIETEKKLFDSCMYLFNESLRHKNQSADFQLTKEFMEAALSHLNFSVTARSAFCDDVWDYNDDVTNASRNVIGSKLRIHFGKYSEIPVLIIIEIKCILYLVNLIPQEFGISKRAVKPNSVLDNVKSGLNYINFVFQFISDNKGRDFAIHKYRSLADVLDAEFCLAAKEYVYCCDQSLVTFFRYLESKIAIDEVFRSKRISANLNSYEWKNKNSKRDRSQIIPDAIFEKLVFTSSILITDFLASLKIEVCDTAVAKYKHLYPADGSSSLSINDEIFNLYRAYRLQNKGHPASFIHSFSGGQRINLAGLRYQLDRALPAGYSCNQLRLYLNNIYYACCYIVAQFTGMRASELAEIIVENEQCLVNSDGIWLVESIVKKTKDINELYGLFDDRWVAIPIVRDAIKAAALIATCKANPFLFSNMDTVAFGCKPQSMNCSGIAHQFRKFVSVVCDKSEIIDFSGHTNMFRHTLTYQLFKADLGLPFISFQLKHFVRGVEHFVSKRAVAKVTLGYGQIGDFIEKGWRIGSSEPVRQRAELESLTMTMDPDGIYYGEAGQAHKSRLRSMFQGYMASGYTKDEILEELVRQGFALISVGQGFCYGGRSEDFDSSVPCIGSLRCNPLRCSNAVITKANLPKWKEIYVQNKANLAKPEYQGNYVQIEAAMDEALKVIEYLEASDTA